VRPFITKLDTKYKKAILVEIKVSCAIYKLAQGANILTCSEHFVIRRSIVTLCASRSGDGDQRVVQKTHNMACW
jgi:hypothetical protein